MKLVALALAGIVFHGCSPVERENKAIHKCSLALQKRATDDRALSCLLDKATASNNQIGRVNAIGQLQVSARIHPEELAPRVVPVLISLLRDPNRSVRRQAGMALGDFKEAAVAAVPALAAALDGDDWQDASYATGLGGICLNPGIAVPALARSVRDGRGGVYSLDALRCFGPKATAAIPALVEALSVPDLSLATSAARALAAVEPAHPALVPAILRLYEQQSGRYRYRVLLAIGEISEASRPPELMRLVEVASEDEEPLVREGANRLLAGKP